MEEPKPAPLVNPNPPITTTAAAAAENPPPPSQPQPPPSTAFPPPLPHHQSKKRKFVDNVDSQYSKYFKIRTIVKDLRPHFIEVLRTPDFRNSKAAEEIKKQMKLLMDLYKQMMSEKATIEECKKPFGVQSLPGESKVEQAPLKRHPEGQTQSDQIPPKILDPTLGGNNSNKKLQDGGIQGSYVVGGSNFGWNFIMYPGNKPIYYGVTKESRKSKVTEEPPCMN